VIVDPGQVEARRRVADGDPLVAQHADAQLLEVSDPLPGARVVLVVAGDEVHTVPRA